MEKLGGYHGRVSDAPSDNWVYRMLPPAIWPYAQLARWDRPIGWQLLLWPCFWSATLAANAAVTVGRFSGGVLLYHLFLYFIGAVAMRGAGCTYNDLVDHEIEDVVARKLRSHQNSQTIEILNLREACGVMRNLLMDIAENEASLDPVTEKTSDQVRKKLVSNHEMRRRELRAEVDAVLRSSTDLARVDASM